MAHDLTALLGFAKDQNASDLHIAPTMTPLVRIRGEMVPLEMAPLSGEETHAAIYDILNDVQKRIFEERHDLDFAFEIPGVSRFRCNVLLQQQGPGAVFRVVPMSVRTLDEMGMPKVLKDLALREKGLVLVTGPTGSGKSTTLAAMVDYINETESAHILTIEDPIEFLHESKRSLVNQREVGPHTECFAAALRAALREDPDVILVGVPALRNLIRENKTAQILSVIQTGAQHGMQSLDQSLRELVMQGKLSREEAMKKSANPSQFDSAGPHAPAAKPAAPPARPLA